MKSWNPDEHPWPESEDVNRTVDMADAFAQLQFEQQMALLNEMREAQKERTAMLAGAVCFASFMALMGWVAWLLIG